MERLVNESRVRECPLCETGGLQLHDTVARCDSCGRIVEGDLLRTIDQIVSLPETLGRHACECGHPEMRRLPDGVFHCPACRAEVIPAGHGMAP